MIVAIVIASALLALGLIAIRSRRTRAHPGERTSMHDLALQEERICRRLYGEHLGAAELVEVVDRPPEDVREKPRWLRAA